jgi:hypothetical protein
MAESDGLPDKHKHGNTLLAAILWLTVLLIVSFVRGPDAIIHMRWVGWVFILAGLGWLWADEWWQGRSDGEVIVILGLLSGPVVLATMGAAYLFATTISAVVVWAICVMCALTQLIFYGVLSRDSAAGDQSRKLILWLDALAIMLVCLAIFWIKSRLFGPPLWFVRWCSDTPGAQVLTGFVATLGTFVPLSLVGFAKPLLRTLRSGGWVIAPLSFLISSLVSQK